MPDFLKHLLFFILSPLMFVALFITYSFYGNDSNGKGWYQELWDGTWYQWLLALILAPIFFPIRWFLNFFYPIWEEWSE